MCFQTSLLMILQRRESHIFRANPLWQMPWCVCVCVCHSSSHVAQAILRKSSGSSLAGEVAFLRTLLVELSLSLGLSNWSTCTALPHNPILSPGIYCKACFPMLYMPMWYVERRNSPSWGKITFGKLCLNMFGKYQRRLPRHVSTVESFLCSSAFAKAMKNL